MKSKRITVLGVGNILFRDEGVGVRVVERLHERYEFPENVNLVDGGVLGLGLLGVISETDHLIVVDAVRNHGEPGTLYRLEGEEVPKRLYAKNSLHQVDLLETLAVVPALDHEPDTVILGVEPEDIETMSLELSPPVRDAVGSLMEGVLRELARLGAAAREKGVTGDVPGHSGEDHRD
jgi:hydrogenase maturation protease